jgi:hypothetical protein
MNGSSNINEAAGDCASDALRIEKTSPGNDVSTPDEQNLPSETVPCEILGAESHHVSPLPRYFRLPKSGKRCPHSGLSRSTLNSLILGHQPRVKSFVVRGAKGGGGVRLICGLSFVWYMRQCLSGCLHTVEIELGGIGENNPANSAEVIE